MEDSLPSNHATYIHLQTHFDQSQKDSVLHQVGYREGKLNRVFLGDLVLFMVNLATLALTVPLPLQTPLEMHQIATPLKIGSAIADAGGATVCSINCQRSLRTTVDAALPFWRKWRKAPPCGQRTKLKLLKLR